jgi:hypothetical protein
MTDINTFSTRLLLLIFSLAGLLTATFAVLRGLNTGPLSPPSLRAAFDAAVHVRAPAPAPAAQPPAPFVLDLTARDAQTAAACLADAIYYEAGFQPLDGQRAVAQVVLNRVRDRNFPRTICGVVYEGWRKKTGCQFSFACDGSLIRRAPDRHEWEQALNVARQALGGYVMAAVGTATHYHTLDVRPWWNATVVQVAQVGSHVFYRWPGRAGQPGALNDARYAGHEARVSSLEYRRARDGGRDLQQRGRRIHGIVRLASGDAARGPRGAA